MDTGIYYGDTSQLEDRALYEALYSLMPASRRAKADRYVFPSDKRLCVGAYSLLLYALRSKGIDGFGEPETHFNRKPYFPSLPDVHFNLSHSGSFAVCVVSDFEAGCDVEKISPKHLGVARRALSKPEQDFLDSASQGDRLSLFFRLWTLKESFMKATGLGFRLVMKDFSVLPDSDGKMSVSFDDTDGIIPTGSYSFFESDAIPGYGFSWCLKDAPRDMAPAPAEFVPLENIPFSLY